MRQRATAETLRGIGSDQGSLLGAFLGGANGMKTSGGPRASARPQIARCEGERCDRVRGRDNVLWPFGSRRLESGVRPESSGLVCRP